MDNKDVKKSQFDARCNVCSEPVSSVGAYPLQDYDISKHVSQEVYKCANGHEKHIPRLTLDTCPICLSSELITHNLPKSTRIKCKCMFRVYQTGVLEDYKTSWDAPYPCILCGRDSCMRISAHTPVYKNSKSHTVVDHMETFKYRCLFCSAAYFRHTCIYCGSDRVVMNNKHLYRGHGKNPDPKIYYTKCYNCNQEWYSGTNPLI